jgi:hypothetical protein
LCDHALSQNVIGAAYLALPGELVHAGLADDHETIGHGNADWLLRLAE